MTVTIVFGKTSDGYLHSYDSTYAGSRNGPADGVTGGAAAWIGQKGPATYQSFQAFLGYDFPAIPNTEIVTAAALRTYIISQRNPTIQNYIEHRTTGGWSGGGLTVADWQGYTGTLDGQFRLTSAATGKFVWTTSDELLARVKIATSIEHVVMTSRQRAGTTPTTDEAISIATADESGTTFDPALVYTSAPRSTLFGVLGAQVKVSTGWAYLESNGATPTPTISLKHRTAAGTVTTIEANVPLSTIGAAECFYPPQGAQGLALVADSTGNLFILGQYSTNNNALGMLPYQKGSGATWTARQFRAFSMPSFDGAINQVAGTWHNVSGGTIFALVGHIGGQPDDADLQYVAISSQALINQTASPIRMMGSAIPTLQPVRPSSTDFNTFANETGTGLDVMDGYAFSFGKGSVLGDNDTLYGSKYELSTAGNSFAHAYVTQEWGWGKKDGAGKVRVVPCGGTLAAYISADQDSGYGLSIYVANHTSSSETFLGLAELADDPITGMPDGPAIASSAAWDAVYNSAENRLWIYFVDTTGTPVLKRTAYDLDSMTRVDNSVTVHTFSSGDTVQAIRVARNSAVTSENLVSCAILNGSTRSTVYVYHAFNIAPNAPTLTPKENFDATTASVFSWTVEDPSGDAQLAYQLEIVNAGTGVVALDTGKVTSATPSRNVAGGTLTNGNSYQWRVRTWDQEDTESPWSAYAGFTTAAGGNVTITVPATDNPLDLITDDITISWSVTGSVQAAYRVWLYRGAELVSDTNWLASTDTSYTVTGMLSDEQHEVHVQTRNASSVTTNIAVRQLKPSYSTPELPLLAAQAIPESGYVLLTIENPTPGSPELGYPEEDFEVSIGTWTPGPNATFARSTEQAHRGTASGKLTSTLNGQDPVYARDYGNFLDVTPGVRYTARMWVYRPTAGAVAPTIDWCDAGGSYLSSSSFGTTAPAAQWMSIQVTGTCPVGASKAVLGPSLTGGVDAGTVLYVDEIVLTGASDRPDVARNEILRRRVDEDGEWEVIGEADPDGTFRDYTAAPNVPYHYIARGQA